MPQFLDLNLPHLESAAIVIDAQANEPAWQEAFVVDKFVSYRPVPDAEPITKATVRVLSDEKALYVHFTIEDPDPDGVFSRYTNRDNIWRSDTAGVYLDPAGDGQRAYLFMCNPLGIQADAHRVAGQGDSFSWDGQWYSAGQRTETGFEIEMAIPWSTVRHPTSIDELGLSFLYSTHRESQRSGWPRRDPNVSGIIIQQAVLKGPGEVPPGNQVHLIPDLTFGLDDEGVSQTRLGMYGMAPGITMRWDPVPELTVLATANPDYSQVEGDEFQIDVNQRYAIYYPEKRPFFLEGQEWLDPGGGMLYTRSMEMPRYGIRATAEQGDWKTAALHVLDASPSGTVHEYGGWTDEEVEGHMALNTLARTRRPFSSEGHIGAFLSHKRIAGTPMENQVVAFDMGARLSDSVTFGAGHAGSVTTLNDGSRISGGAASMGIEHENREWEIGAGMHAVSPDFRAENGYVTRGDLFGMDGWIERSFYPKIDKVQAWRMMLNGDSAWRLDGSLRSLNIQPGLSGRFAKNAFGYTSASFWKEEYEGQLFQGPYAMAYLGQSVSKYWGVSVNGGGGQGIYYDSENPRMVDEVSAATALTLRPTDRISIENSVQWTRLSEDGDSLENGYVARIYVTGFFTDKAWLRSIFDYSSFSESVQIDTLFAWQRNPGTAFYLGTSNDLTENTWQAFAKLSWSLGL